MPFAKITVENIGDVAVIRLNEPETLNAMSEQMVDELALAFDQSINGARAIVLGSVGRAFSSGASLTGGLALDGEAGIDPADVLDKFVNPFIIKMKNLPIPVVSAVRGPAAGVGCSIALAADIILASDTAYFLQAFSRIGLVPDGGSTWLLARAIGRPRAMEMMLLGDRLPAAQALEWGLINRVVADAELDKIAIDFGTKLASGPSKALGLIRKLAWTAADASLEDMLTEECATQREAISTSDAQEGIRAFVEKRAPHFIGA